MPEAALEGQGRVVAFTMFGPVFGYASESGGDLQTAYVGPLTPGVPWVRLWRLATRCCREPAQDRERAQWIITQSTRAVITQADVVAQLAHAPWRMAAGGRRMSVGHWANHEVLITGNMSVPDLAPGQVSSRPTRYPHYLDDLDDLDDLA